MLIHSASQLLTLAGGPQRGKALGSLGVVENGAVVMRDEKIIAVGSTDELRNAYPDEPTLDAGRCVLMPGFVDPHTHIVWAGDRANEFEMKMSGTPYLDILAAGGGILSTVKATRAASIETLMAETRPRLLRMFRNGTTTAETKTGYGLQTSTELRLLKALLALNDESPLDLVFTFLGAHAIAPEYRDNPQGYTDEVADTMLPTLKEWWETHAPRHPLPFVDVFCETKAFTLEQSRQILTRARSLGFPVKIHADEFDNLGGASLAAELNAASADHLVVTSDADIAALGKSDTVAVALPCTPFGLAESHYTPAKKLLEANAVLAIATDCNPGTSWNESMQFAIALACRYMKLTPAQAIAAATINAAHAIRRADSIGSIEVGKQADMLILSVGDYRQVGYRYGTNLVRHIVKRGQVYSVDVGYYRTAYQTITSIARSKVMEHLPEMVFVLDEKERIVDANAVAQKWLGKSLKEIIGRDALEVFKPWPQLLKRFFFLERSREEIEIPGEPPRILETIITPILNRANQIEGRVILAYDITERKKLEEELKTANLALQTQLEVNERLRLQLQEQAIRDPLTGVFNRRYFAEALDREIARAARENAPFSLIILDVDHFKRVNDAYGHKCGDMVLISLANYLTENTRRSDILCRFGGEEFVILMPDAAVDDARERAELFRAEFESLSHTCEDKPIKATFSAGVASFPIHAGSGDALLVSADQALYQSKSAGRNRVSVFDAVKESSE